jgi:hypothetical protein
MRTASLPVLRTILVLAAAYPGHAQSTQSLPVMIRLTSETAPPGGMAQIKAVVYSPQPIMSGLGMLDMGSYDIEGIALFSGTGDVVGTAVVSGGKLKLQIFSPNGTFGSFGGYPLLTVAVSVPANAVPGQQIAVAPDPGSSWSVDVKGVWQPVQLQPGKITVGGSVSIANVVPGGGTLPAGAAFSIFGVGFSPQTQVALQGITASSIAYVSPTQILVTLQKAATLDGTLIQVKNPDNSSDSYYSYMRGVPVGQSSDPLLAQTVPVFSTIANTGAILPPTISSQVNPAYFTAVAFQNPSQASATIAVQSVASGGQVTGSAQVTLAPGHRISREISELLGSALPTGSYLRVTSTQPVQMLGMLGNHSTGVVLPVVFVSTAAAAVQTDIQLVGVAQNGSPAVGSDDSFTWHIKNNQGAIPAPGVTFNSVLPAGFQINSVTPSQGTCSVAAPAIRCSLGQIEGGATALVTVHFSPTQAGTFSTTALANFSGIDTNPANNSFTLTIGPR